MTDEVSWYGSPARVVWFTGGMGLCSVSLSSGFIWVCGAPCVTDPVVWTAGRRVPLAFLAAFLAWWGYLLAHRAVTGRFVDSASHGAGEGATEVGPPSTESPVARTRAALRGMTPPTRTRQAGMLFGLAALVGGIVVGFVYIRQGNHLLTNVGGALFLGGYVLAHQAETGKPL
ncbi:hypothetical protein N0B31_03785 [Salinirubellus salinus]|uniref:Uncharacterized protein n=1 Tax=Salinirubellus salinus TaxID=1364945 RepID=A0A9E7R438_9EURY|nr:hypothetical protein [Salinirubellus salinus]UWM55409.1 hypothetical protein N0B31_03785 [Salinirubellus salinus]